MEDLMGMFSDYSEFAATEEEDYESRRQEQLDQIMNETDSLLDIDEIAPAEFTDDELIELQLTEEFNKKEVIQQWLYQ